MEQRRWLSAVVESMILLALLAAQPTSADQLYAQVAVHAPGVNGSFWYTDLEVQNVTSAAVSFTVDYLSASPLSVNLSVAAGGAVRYEDILGTLFGLTSDVGALRISSPGRELRVTGRAYNQSTAGTYGQLVPVQSASEAFAYGQDVYLIQLAKDSACRTNVAVLNTSESTIAADVILYDSSGTVLGPLTLVAPPYELTRVNNVFAAVGAGDVADGYAVVRTTTAGGRFMTYAAVVDNASNDAWTVPGQRPAASPEPLYVPFVAHDASWLSDVEILAVGDETAAVSVELLETDQDNTAPLVSIVNLGAGTAVRLTDVLDTVFAFAGTGALRVTPTSGSVVVSSRTFYRAYPAPRATWFRPTRPAPPAAPPRPPP